jgi:hypothetical protein
LQAASNCPGGATFSQRSLRKSIERLNAAQQATIADLGRQLDASKEQILGFFRIIDEAEIEATAIPARLVEIAERYKALVAQAEAEAGDDPETARLKAELREALEKLDLDRADALLAEVLAAQDRDLENRALQAAATCARRGDLARTRLRYNEAAAHFRAAAGRVPSGHDIARGEYLFEHASALYQQGNEFGDNAALQISIEVWRTVLTFYPRERAPLDWAMTQNNLASRSGRSASGRAGRGGSKRRSPLIARRWRNTRANACRCNGR